MKKREFIKIGHEDFTLKNKVLNYNGTEIPAYGYIKVN